MTLPLTDAAPWLMVVLGLLFGYFLEAGGLASPRKLAAQLTLRDWTVFKVMFTAILVAALMLYLSDLAGWLRPAAVKIPTPFYGAMAVGGALLGIGMAVGGYCPGTAVAGLATGRLDALLFLLGLMAGVLVFALLADDLSWLFKAGEGAPGETLATLTGWPVWTWLILLGVLAAAGYRFGAWMERRGNAAAAPEGRTP